MLEVLTSRMGSATRRLFLELAARATVKRRRTFREFAEQEIVLPTGPDRNFRYRADRNPFSQLLLNELDSGQWKRFFTTGPRQSGKTLHGSCMPVMYHLFEIGEDVIYGVPDLNMVGDKWAKDLEPIIAASRYREFLPTKGSGSRGGKITQIQFKNGATLKFMTAGGGDKGRAGYTSRILVVTEVDGFDRVSEASKEGDKFSQIEECTSSFIQRRIYAECTVTDDKGRTWTEYSAGTQSRIAIRCPHCQVYVTPERENLIGWQDAIDVISAGENARVACPSCGAMWTEAERAAANRDCRLVHRGQEITADGKITGPLPRTETLGFRWTAINNLLVPISVAAQKEWTAARSPDEENSDKVLRQFTWALPHQPEAIDLSQLDAVSICQRVTKDARGRIPSGATRIGFGVDLGQHFLNWTALAEFANESTHVFDYGTWDVHSDSMEVDRALLKALREIREQVCIPGWESDDGRVSPDMHLVDSGWFPDVAYAFCRESGPDWLPSKGVGGGRERQLAYRQPKNTGTGVAFIGDAYHVVRLTKKRVKLLEVDPDAWKARVHSALGVPVGQPGAMTLFQAMGNAGKADAQSHRRYANHIVAEKLEERWEPGRGVVRRFIQIRPQNHYLDSTTLARIAIDYAARRQVVSANWQRPVNPARAAERIETANNEQTDSGVGADESEVEVADAATVADGGDGSKWWGARKKRR